MAEDGDGFFDAVDPSSNPRSVHLNAYQKWQREGIRELTKEELTVLRKHAFKPPARSSKNVIQTQTQNNPGELKSLLEVASMFHAKGEYDEAEEALRAAVELEPRCLPAILHLGFLVQSVKKDYGEAESLFTKAIIAYPKSPTVLSHFGLLEHARGANAKAEEYYRKAVMSPYDGPLNKCELTLPQLSFVCAEAFVELGLILEDAFGHYEGAEAVYRKAVAMDSSSIKGLYKLAVLLHYIKHEYDEAEQHYRSILALHPQHVNALCNLGVLLCNARDQFDEAERLYQKALGTDPGDPSALCLLATMLDDKGECSQALALYNMALGRKPETETES